MTRQFDFSDALRQRRDAVVSLWERCRDVCTNDFEKVAIDELFMPQIAAIEHALEQMML